MGVYGEQKSYKKHYAVVPPSLSRSRFTMTMCIYCNQRDANSREHVIPACMGEFRNFGHLNNKLCTCCNGDLKLIDEQFCRCGPEAFFRRIIGIKGRKRHKKINPFYRGSAGGKHIVIETQHPSIDCKILCEIDEKGEENPYPARQIIFLDSQNKYHSIPITEEMREKEDLQREIDKRGISNSKPVECWASLEEEGWIKRLCTGFNVKIEWNDTELFNKEENTLFVATLTVNSSYFRAVAKIAFHYFLKNFNQFTGFEKEFDGIKQLILNGGNPDNFVRQVEGSFVQGLRPGVTTTDKYGHLLAVDKDENNICVRLHFFVGPKGVPNQHYLVSIGKNPEKIIYPQSIGHQFVYFDD